MPIETVTVETQGRAGTYRRRRFFSGPQVRLHWGAILAGVVVALAVWALLYAFGVAVGLSVLDPSQPNSLKASGIFTGIWSLIIPIIALFAGGAVASRGADVWTRVEGGLHGLVVWGLVTLVGAWLLTGVLSSVLGGVGASAAGSALLREAMGASPPSAAVYEQEAIAALRPVNERLRAEGRAQVNPEDLRGSVFFVLQDAVRGGELNREVLIGSITRNTTLSQADADVIASRLASRFEEAKQNAQAAALRAADATGKAFWGVFGVLVLSLLSALAGSTIGVAKRQRLTPSSTVTTAPTPFPHETHEVHP